MTETVFLTFDCDGALISRGARIGRFESEAEALAVARERYKDGDVTVTGLEGGEYSDCWIKSYDEPSVDSLTELASEIGMTTDDLIIHPPGTHPGGREWWITPRVDVLVPTFGPLP